MSDGWNSLYQSQRPRKVQDTAETEFKRTGGECLLHENEGQNGTGVLGLQDPWDSNSSGSKLSDLAKVGLWVMIML